MKKVVSIVMILMTALMCIGCGGDKNEKAVLTMANEAAGVAYEMTLEAKDDVVHTMTQATTVDLTIYSEEQVAMLRSSIDEYAATYQAFNGVQYSSDIGEKEISEKIVIDLSNAITVKALSDAGLLPIQGGTNSISLEATVKALQAAGWTLK